MLSLPSTFSSNYIVMMINYIKY